SLTTAVSVDIDPACTLSGFGVTTTEPTTAGVTVRVSAACLVSILAVTMAVPTLRHCTNPTLDTVAVAFEDEDQATARPIRTFPTESLAVAVIDKDAPAEQLCWPAGLS